jgi:hypothetical protein
MPKGVECDRSAQQDRKTVVLDAVKVSKRYFPVPGHCGMQRVATKTVRGAFANSSGRDCLATVEESENRGDRNGSNSRACDRLVESRQQTSATDRQYTADQNAINIQPDIYAHATAHSRSLAHPTTHRTTIPTPKVIAHAVIKSLFPLLGQSPNDPDLMVVV